jgi:hypothetical protein
MSDGLTAPPAPSTPPAPDVVAPRVRAGLAPWLVVLLQAVAVLVAFAASGVVAGRVWYHLWDAPSGVVSGGQWYTNEAGLRDDFQGVALYVAIGAGLGLVLGSLCAWLLDRSELVTMVAVLAGSVLAAYVMFRVGTHLSPSDPHELAKTAQDGDKLKGALQVTSWPPRGACTFGAMVGLALVYAVSMGKKPAEVGDPALADPAWRHTPPR